MYPPPGAPFDWEEYMRQQQRAGLAAGGVPPVEPEPVRTPLDELPEPDPVEVEEAAPSPAQIAAKQRYGIGSTGPLAQRATQDISDYAVKRSESFDRLGQHEPQQFGKIEGTFLAEGPRTPKDAVEAFMAAKENQTYAQQRGLGAVTDRSRDEILAKNAAYERKVEADRLKRDEQRDRQRQQGYLNRAATRDKQTDMWEQFRAINGMQGGGMGGGRMGMPGAYNAGGAILLPGLGREPQYMMPGYGRGYGGSRGGMTPEQYDLRLREIKRLEDKDKANAELGGRRATTAEKALEIRQTIADATMDRFKIENNQRVERTMDEKRDRFNALMADYDRRSKAQLAAGMAGGDKMAAADLSEDVPDPNNPGKYLPGAPYPGSFNAIKRRILQLGTELARADEAGQYSFDVTPDVIEKWNQIKAGLDAEKMATPQP